MQLEIMFEQNQKNHIFDKNLSICKMLGVAFDSLKLIELMISTMKTNINNINQHGKNTRAHLNG